MVDGSEVAAHFHRTFSESFYVLSGRMELWTGDAWRGVSPGDLAYVPRGGIPRERFVLELLEIRQSGRQLTHEEWADFYARHDQYLA